MIYIHKCLRCNHEWPSHNEHPTVCAGCKTPYWDKIRVIKKAKANAVVIDNTGLHIDYTVLEMEYRDSHLESGYTVIPKRPYFKKQ